MIELTEHDLPAYCPNPKMPLWSSHQRVYLDVINQREAMCPYCGTRYRLGTEFTERDFDTLGLNQHHQEPPLEPLAPPAAGEPDDAPEAFNLRADRQGNTTLEQITRWLTRR